MSRAPARRALAVAILAAYAASAQAETGVRTNDAASAGASPATDAAAAAAGYDADTALVDAAAADAASIREREARRRGRKLDSVEVEADTFRPFSSDQSSTGMKFDAPLRDVPQSVTVVPQAVIETQAATTLADALRNVAGLTLASGEGGFTGDNVTLRGFAARTDQYVNGVRDNAQFVRDTFNIERVEVLKGASSMLFGRGGTGGVINSITKRPTGEVLRVLTVMGGSDSYGRFSADVDQPVGDAAGVRVNLMWQDNESFRDVVETERKGLAPSFRLDLSDATSVTTDFYYLDHDGILDYGLPWNLATGKPIDVPIDTFYGAGKQSFYKTEVYEGRVGFEHEFGNGAILRNNTAYGHFDRAYRTVRPNTVLTITTPPETALPATITRNHNLVGGSQMNVYNLTDLAFDFETGGWKHDFATGLELGWEDFSQKNRANLPVLPAVPTFDPQSVILPTLPSSVDGGAPLSTYSKVDTETTALYFQDTISFTEQWKGVLGVRHDQFDADVRNMLTGTELTRDDDMTSYRVGGLFQPGADQSYYGSWSTSFNPSAETFTLSDATQRLDPEENENWELGAKLTPWGDRISLNMAVFRLEKTNARTVDPSNTSLQVLDGLQRSDGFEIEVQGAITRDWRIFAGAAWMDPEIVETNEVVNGASTEGNRPANASEFTANLWTVYQLGRGWEIGGGAFHVGNRYANTANTLELPSYTRYDAYVGWSNGPYRLALNVYNLSDKQYFEFAHPVFATPGAERNARVSFTYAF